VRDINVEQTTTPRNPERSEGRNFEHAIARVADTSLPTVGVLFAYSRLIDLQYTVEIFGTIIDKP
jgi:hypothetical protein